MINKRYRKYLWLVLPVIALALLLPVLFSPSKPVQRKLPENILNLQNTPGIIHLDLPNPTGGNTVAILKITSDGPSETIFNQAQFAEAQQFFSLYLDLSPKDQSFLWTQSIANESTICSTSPLRQNNETIVDYALDPAPQPWGKDGVKRCYIKYTTTPGQKVSPDMTKVLPGETGMAWQIKQGSK